MVSFGTVAGLALSAFERFALPEIVRAVGRARPAAPSRHGPVTVPLDRRVFHKVDRAAKDMTDGKRPYVHLAAVGLRDMRVMGVFKVARDAKIEPNADVVMARLDYI